jgi:GT2 family glycosyltransferase
MPAPLAPLVSVVVPMFNVERYLLDCLESLPGQTLRDLEVVMVDDGSTDSTASIAAAFAAGTAGSCSCGNRTGALVRLATPARIGPPASTWPSSTATT